MNFPGVLLWIRRDWLWPLLIYGTVLTVSGRSEVAVPSGLNFFQADKLAHFLVFGALATAMIRIPEVRGLGRRSGLLVMVLVSLAGAADELWQSFTPGRVVEVDDWLADTAGGIVATLCYLHWPWYRRLLETPVFRKMRPPNSGD